MLSRHDLITINYNPVRASFKADHPEYNDLLTQKQQGRPKIPDGP
jgi:hypothetical protein